MKPSIETIRFRDTDALRLNGWAIEGFYRFSP